jgi:hypothetical protein
MNHIIHNISIILIFLGIILLTHNLTKSYNKNLNKNQYDDLNKNQYDLNKNQYDLNKNQDEPSNIYKDMFNNADTWMGYADNYTKAFQNKLI